MMIKRLMILCLCIVSCITNNTTKSKVLPTEEKNKQSDAGLLDYRINNLLGYKAVANQFPHSSDKKANLITKEGKRWTSGFFPGNLWLAYKYTNNDKFKIAAEQWTPHIEQQQFNENTHDIGFMIYCSIGSAYAITQEVKYKDIIIQAGQSLSMRFSKRIGAIRSFDKASWHTWDYPVIIDNMMNLELLYAASKLSGDNKYAIIATEHALTTMKNHYREDYSSYHVVNYDEKTGEIIKKETYQGYADESSWSRGQAWGLYGFITCYRETKDKRFLDHAINIADYIRNHPNTPEDKVPYWDYNAPDIPNAPRDASAGAIIASALFQLYDLTGDNQYKNDAKILLRSLTSKAYLLPVDNTLPFILDHSTGFLPKPVEKEIDVPLVYADYYFLEALNLLNDME